MPHIDTSVGQLLTAQEALTCLKRKRTSTRALRATETLVETLARRVRRTAIIKSIDYAFHIIEREREREQRVEFSDSATEVI